MSRTKLCPYCKEKIKRDAIVCRYCHRELNEKSEEKNPCQMGIPLWALAGTVGVCLGGVFALALALAKERRHWQEEYTEWKGDDE